MRKFRPNRPSPDQVVTAVLVAALVLLLGIWVHARVHRALGCHGTVVYGPLGTPYCVRGEWP